jgi:predicted DNA-binding protein
MLEKKTKKVTVRFAKRLKAEMLNALVHSGYGLRGKSKWVAEAIHLFLKQSNFVEFAEQGIDINQAELTEIEAFYLDHDVIERVKKASIAIRKQYPLFEGVQSALIRAAVIYRLMLGK